MLGENLIINYEEAAAMILFSIGFCMLLFHRNLAKNQNQISKSSKNSLVVPSDLGSPQKRVSSGFS